MKNVCIAEIFWKKVAPLILGLEKVWEMKAKQKKYIKFLRKQFVRAIKAMSVTLKPKHNLVESFLLQKVSVINWALIWNSSP